MDKPVIFLAFANNQDEYLPMLNRERKNIYRSLRIFDDNDTIKLEAEATTSLEDIFEVFIQYDNLIHIFHYAGHANSYQLQLENADRSEQTAYATGLAQLLGRQKNLKLVFLNGCATKTQVDLLLKQGVSAVIATSAAVQDKMATEFAELFYNALAGHSTIERSFQIAKAFISSKYKYNQAIQVYRDMVMSFDETETAPENFPWGLYLSEGSEDILNWTLPFPETSYQASNTKNLLNRVPSTTTSFVGYEKELTEFGVGLKEFPLIAIEGIGGVGKTEFSIEAIKRFITQRDRVIWVSPITRFDAMVQQSGYEEILLMDNPDEVLKFKSLEGLLDRDNRIVFIEDFHDNDDPTFLRFFEQLSISLARIIIITRFLVEEIEPGVVIKLDGLGADAMSHARNLRGRKAAYEDIPDEDLATICRLTEGHPLSLELGMQLLGYGESAEDILDAISGGEYTEHKKVEELSQRLLRSVLDHGNTSQKEKNLLLKFSVFRNRVPLEAIQALVDNPRVKYTLSQLIEKSLIRHRDKLYDSPPLVREFCRVMLKDSIDIHERAADYFMDERGDDFDIVMEENIIYHLSESNQWEMLGTSIKQNGKRFIAHGQTHLLQSIINKLSEHDVDQPVFDIFQTEILRLKGEFKKARRPLKKALATYRDEGDQSGIAHALNVLGEVMMGLSDFEAAEKALQEALQIALHIKAPMIAISSYENLALTKINKGQVEEALNLVNEGLVLAEEIGDQFGIASLLNAQGRIFVIRRDFDQALISRKKSFSLFSGLGARAYVVSVCNNIAVTLNFLGRHQEALEELERALNIEMEIGAKYRIGNLYNNIGRILLRIGKQEEALEKIKESLDIHSSINNTFGKASSYHGLGMCFSQLGRYHDAIEHFQSSLKISEDIGYQIGVLNLYKEIGRTYQQLPAEEDLKAIEWFVRAHILNMEMNATKGQEITDCLSQIKEKIGAPAFEEQLKLVQEMLSDQQKQTFDSNSIFGTN